MSTVKVYGLDGVPLATYTGDGTISYWNGYVAVTQMGGQGTFVDPRIGVDVIHEPDLVTPKTLLDVVNHYDDHMDLELTDDDKNDLVEYLKSL